MEQPLLVEIIAYAPTAFYHCTHCEVAWREMGASNRIHEEQVESSLPEDMAKVGYLWLHRGNWDGRQIVSEAWVLDSVSAHSKFIGVDFAYGYGWWVSPGDYYAVGRGGQRIRVMASANTLVVTTGGTFDYADIQAWLTWSLSMPRAWARLSCSSRLSRSRSCRAAIL